MTSPEADQFRELAADYSGRAAAYARHWAPVIHPMARPLLDAIPLAGVKRILDVGAGSGGLWPPIRRAAPGAKLYGVDGSEGMLRAGGDLLRGRSAVMDAQRLGIRPGSFDTVLLLFVLFHVPDPRAALREALAALRPGGTLGLVLWGEDPGLPGRDIWTEELDRVGAAPDPRDPAVMRQAWMDTPEKVTDLIERDGFSAERVWSRRFAHAWSVESLLATQTSCGLPSRRLDSLGADARTECRSRVRSRLKLLTPADLEYRVEVLYAIAKRSE